jgi:UDP-4-amino-4,6-dideoxy-N-acetyl-beta-L-altrosamine transaminase
MSRMIPYGKHYVDEADIAAVVDVMRHGWLTQGERIAEFERAVADYVGARYAVAVSSGTAALHLACMAGGLEEGEVAVTTPNTFVASANCARYVGANVALADIHPESLNLDADALAARCHSLRRVGAVVPVHFAGLPCDMDRIAPVARAHGARIVEDASHALGATYADGSRVGNCRYADATVFSFHPVKLIATGEGGMVTTNDPAIHRRLLRLRSHGINKEDDPLKIAALAGPADDLNPWYYEMQELGFNHRITDIQCALGLSQFRKLEQFLGRRRELARRYDTALADLPHVRRAQPADWGRHALHLYVLRVDFKALGVPRRAVMQRLRRAGIVTQVHYIPVHYHPYYRELGLAVERYTHAEAYYEEALSIPLYYSLSDEDQEHVVRLLKDALAGGAA